MTNRERISFDKKSVADKSQSRSTDHEHKNPSLASMLQRLGNRNIQRLVVQRDGAQPYELDDDTAGKITRERGNGAPLESKLQMQMSDQLGFDMSGVRVHTSHASDQLNQKLSARAFTTGQDVFFRSGAYNPESTSGKELITHELTHVVQQGTGQVQNQGGMTVNAPGDQYEQEADSVAKGLSSNAVPAVQTQEEEELQMNGEEEEVQMQEEDELQMNGEEEEVQMQEDEEELQMHRQ